MTLQTKFHIKWFRSFAYWMQYSRMTSRGSSWHVRREKKLPWTPRRNRTSTKVMRPNTAWKLSLKSETSLFYILITDSGHWWGTYTKQVHFLVPFCQPVIWAIDEWHRHNRDKITCFMVNGCKTHWKLTLMIAFFWLPTLAVHMHSELPSAASHEYCTRSIFMYTILCTWI